LPVRIHAKIIKGCEDRIMTRGDELMEPNPKVRYDTITGTVRKITEQLNDPIRATWRPILMAGLPPNTLVVLLEKSDTQS